MIVILQLGMMVIAIGLSSYNIAIFHLINHAFYKGLLFLGAGAVIHAVVDNQDLRKYGGLRLYLPLTYTVILIASLSLVAFPFMTGFYSKDFILESAYGQYYFSGVAVYAIAVIGAIFTTLYSVKVLYLTFLTNPNGSLNYYRNSQGLESDIFISLPLVILAQFSIYFGYITKDIYIGLGSGFFADNSIFIHPMHEILIDTEFGVATIFKLIPLIFTLFFSGIAIIYSEFIPNVISKFKLSNLGYNIFGFFNQRFLVEFFYNKFIVNKVLYLGSQTTQVLDKGSIELIGPYGMSVISIKVSKTISRLSKGIITDYALNILTGVCLYLTIFTYLSVFVDLTYSVTISCLFILILSGSSLYTHHLKQLEEQNSSQFVRSFVYTEECFAGNKNHQLNSSFPPFKGGLVLHSKKLLKYLLKIGIYLLISNLFGFVWNDSIFMDGDGDSETEKPKDKGKGKLIEDTPKGQSSSEGDPTQNSSQDILTEHEIKVKENILKRELELYQELLKFEGENMAKEKENFLKTGEIPAHSLHTVAAETSRHDVNEMSELERKIADLGIKANDGDTKSSNKRSLDSAIFPQHAGESEDLGGPSVKKTKYESSSESEDLGGPSVKKKK
jgi:NADH-ubiquinone oxidoreductase chain 5